MNIVKECPRVLHQREESCMLFPALFAATLASESDEHLSVTYELLKETPELMLHALDVASLQRIIIPLWWEPTYVARYIQRYQL